MSNFTLLRRVVLLVVVTIVIIGIPKASPALSAEIESDRVALLAIKSKITLDPQGALRSWNDSLDVCLWEGVTCGRQHKKVTQLKLAAKGLGGTLSPFVGNLSFLHFLSLYNNTFRGIVPPQLGRLARLQKLDLTRNEFQGEIPPNISSCLQLTHLGLDGNYLSGKIPFELNFLSNLQRLGISKNNLTGYLSPLSNLTSLQELYLSRQTEQGGPGFQGAIPEFIGNFKHLTILALSENGFSGKIPTSLYNLSNLRVLDLGANYLQGSLPYDFGFFFPQLQLLQLDYNHLSGPVPFSMSNLSSLEIFDLSNNNFAGKFLFDAQNMKNISYIIIYNANLGTREVDDLYFLNTLVNSSQLKLLSISNNNFGGNLPQSIVRLSPKLKYLEFSSNQISGSIPSGLSRYFNLLYLTFSDNHLTGTIPQDIGKITKLQQAFFDMNRLSGSIPMSVGNLSMLSHLALSFNKFQGSIPATLGNCKNLQELYLNDNNLVGNVPPQLFRSSLLIIVDLSNNHLQGSLTSKVGDLKELVYLNVNNNYFSGTIPTALDQCVALQILNLSINSFVGSIPPSFSLLKSLQVIDLSSNKLSGQVPAYFSNFSYLEVLNLSFNNLEGDVPIGGVLSNLSMTTLIGNNKLCGGIPQFKLPTCQNAKSHRKAIVIITIIVISCVLVGLIMFLCSIFLLCARRRKRSASSPSLGGKSMEPLAKVSYEMLLKATNGFSAENLIGLGSYGSVYKGVLFLYGEEQIVAIKVVNNQRQGAGKSFEMECKALRTIRHRNLVKVITACSSIDFQGNAFSALVYDLMPKGSLERWLYSNPQEDGATSNLTTLLQRLNIAIDVAHALDYLHNGLDTPIIHYDLKPANILLNEELVAHVGDFGLVKLLPQVSEQLYSGSSIGVRGTFGYVAPEYGLGSSISAAGDVYSYGIILLELMTAKKPTDVMFEGGKNLHKFADSALTNCVLDIVDPKLGVDDHDDVNDPEIHINFTDNKRGSVSKCVYECITSMIMTGIRCSFELPQSRMDIKEVICELHSQRDRLLLCGRHRCQRIL